MERELDYYCRRAAQERQAATNAAHPLAAEAHLQMAERYEDMTGEKPADVFASAPECPIVGSAHGNG